MGKIRGDFVSIFGKIKKIEKGIKKALLKNNQRKLITLISKYLEYAKYLCKTQLIADCIQSYYDKIEDVKLFKDTIGISVLREIINDLIKNNQESAALTLCELGFDNEAVEIYSKLGKANEIGIRMTKGNLSDRTGLQKIAETWERYNGDIRNSPTLENVLKSIATYSPEIIPLLPRLKEVVGHFGEAAKLYITENDIQNAAVCYEKANLYQEASEIYERIGDNEGVSRNAEGSGDYERALRFVVNPERKVKLLILMERFNEALKLTGGLNSPDEYLNMIRDKAGQRLKAKMDSLDFIAALELAEFAESNQKERDEILSKAQEYFQRKIAATLSEEEIENIYRKWVKIEVIAGRFEEAARIAEEVLNDLQLAGSLYEKANLYNLAIQTAESHFSAQKDKHKANLRLAELHEKGGNLIKAAKLYESLEDYEKAYTLYETSGNYYMAIDCYLQLKNQSTDVLAQLYNRAGEFEKVVELYMKSGNFTDLEKALSIAKRHNLTSHRRVLQEKLAEHYSGNEDDLKECFEKAYKKVLDSYTNTLGIDFGTTNSVVAIYNKKTKEIEIVTSSDGMKYEPSFYGLDENNHPIIGEKARKRWLISSESFVGRSKRNLGYGGSFQVGKKKCKTEEVVAEILHRLKSNAEEYLISKVKEDFFNEIYKKNLRFPDKTMEQYLIKQRERFRVDDVVLSVPAYFNDNQKRATRDSAEIAGINVKKLIHEPTAAALAYGYRKPYQGKLAVIDLGGGTLDVSILDINNEIYDVLTVGGDVKLGGSDIDSLLVRCVLKDIRAKLGVEISERNHPDLFARLRDGCENLKINLSAVNEYTMELPYFMKQPKYSFTMKRKELEELALPILDKVVDEIQNSLKRCNKRVEHYLLIGNATKMPIFKDLVEKATNAKYIGGIDPGTAVATGNALEAAVLTGDIEKTLLLDIVPYSLGIVTKDRKDNLEKMSRLIEKDTKIPTKKTDMFTTTEENQNTVRIKIYQGESNEPYQNYYLGEFTLGGIKSAPAGTPKIEVTFDIGLDCILTVTAKDQETGEMKSITIKDAITLSPVEKQKLKEHFAESDIMTSLEKELQTIREEIKEIKLFIDNETKKTNVSVNDFYELFKEKIETNASLYKIDKQQTEVIQTMYLQKEQLLYDITKYKDQYASIVRNIDSIESKHLDFANKNIVNFLKDCYNALEHFKDELERLVRNIENNVSSVLEKWISLLRSIEPNKKKMDSLDAANYYLTVGKVTKAIELLEAIALSEQGLTRKAFQLFLECYIKDGLREEYRNTHRRYGSLFGITYPDFNRLNTYLKEIDESVFMIQGVSKEDNASIGTGFCIAPNLIITNRHVVEGSTHSMIQIIGKDKTYPADDMELDETNDIAVLKVRDKLRPLRLGDFDFVEPGESVLAIGFPSPESPQHSDNIYISNGIVNSIRKTDFSPERVIYIDAKIGRGMSGGPLINDLGEVVGIITLIRYAYGEIDKGIFATEEQPIALPIRLIRRFLK